MTHPPAIARAKPTGYINPASKPAAKATSMRAGMEEGAEKQEQNARHSEDGGKIGRGVGLSGDVCGRVED